jgi:hypothetical protein
MAAPLPEIGQKLTVIPVRANRTSSPDEMYWINDDFAGRRHADRRLAATLRDRCPALRSVSTPTTRMGLEGRPAIVTVRRTQHQIG